LPLAKTHAQAKFIFSAWRSLVIPVAELTGRREENGEKKRTERKLVETQIAGKQIRLITMANDNKRFQRQESRTQHERVKKKMNNTSAVY
jgi:hypothetical protein